MAKQFTPTARSELSSSFASATQDELVVSQILLEFESLFVLPESCINFSWGRKKRRSSFEETPSSSPAPTPPVRRSDDDVEVNPVAGAAATSSPTTPLSFSPSESDEKSKRRSNQRSKKRSREKYNDMIEELSECGNLLRGELEKMRNYYNELRTHNSELKAMKLKVLNTCPIKGDPQRETLGFTNLVVDPTQHYRSTMLTRPQPLIADPTAQKFQHPFGPILAPAPQVSSYCNGLQLVNKLGPANKIPDLNLCAEEAIEVDTFQSLDLDRALADKRARCAEARRLRRGIIKINRGVFNPNFYRLLVTYLNDRLL